jgi:glycerol-1-phosphatase
VALTPLAAGYEILLLDLDGCLWVGDQATRRAPEALGALRAAGKRVGFITNDARSAPEDFVRKLWRLGFQASAREVVTVGGALQFALAERYPGGATATVIGAPAIHRHVRPAGLRVVNGTDLGPRAEVVVIAGHEGFDYAELREAVQAALRGAALLAAGRDGTFPMPDGPWPATGAIVAAVETAAERAAESVGKPEAGIFRTALDRLGGGRALAVGDRIDADLAGAHAAGLDGALVLTGASTAAMARDADPAPAFVAGSLAELLLAP